jgi:hypothetical protein
MGWANGEVSCQGGDYYDARRGSKETALLPFHVKFPEINFKGEKTP